MLTDKRRTDEQRHAIMCPLFYVHKHTVIKFHQHFSSWLSSYAIHNLKIKYKNKYNKQSLKQRNQKQLLFYAKLSDLIDIPIKLCEDTLTVTEIWRIQECYEKRNQREMTWKQRKGEQPFSRVIPCPDLIHISIKLHEDIPNCYWVTAHTRMLGKINQRGITWKIKKRRPIILVCNTSFWL